MKKIEGAGGTSGGIGGFIAGAGMFFVGMYMLLNKITVSNSFGAGSHGLYRVNHFVGTNFSFNVTSGMIFIPMIIGIIMIFYNGKSLFGWLLAGLSMAALLFGVIASTSIRMHSMSAFDATVIFVLAFGGFGLLLRSIKAS